MSEQDAADEEGEDRAGEGTDGSAENGVSEGDATPDAADGAADSTGDTDHEGTDAEDGEATVDEDLVERVAESDPETVATELAALRERVDGLEAELDERDDEIEDLESELKRKQADFQNYKKRMEKRREQEKQRATEDLVERLLDVRDNLVRALDQAEGADAEDVRSGVETTLAQFDRVLEGENVDVVDPEPGEEVDPHTHEVLMRVDSDQPEGTIDAVHRPGYVMAEKVLQTAQVTVSDGDEGDDRTRSETV
jgi:molecular chaperone GrpE